MCVCEYACTCACVRAHVRAHVRRAVCVCVCLCVCVAGAHVCRAPGAVQECHAPGLGCMCVMLQVLGLGLGLGRGLLCSSLITHPKNLKFANPGQPRGLKINMY
jgi:hypothetical protein